MEKVVQLVDDDHQSVRKTLGWKEGDHRLTGQRIVDYMQAFAKLWPKDRAMNRPYRYMEPGHKAACEHLVQSIHESVPGGLTEFEEKVVRQVLGNVFEQPPRERRKSHTAALMLLKMGRRGTEIYSRLQEEAEKLEREKSAAAEIINGENRDWVKWRQGETREDYLRRIQDNIPEIKPEYKDMNDRYGDQFANPIGIIDRATSGTLLEFIRYKKRLIRGRRAAYA